jgi:hypothetical protein
MEPDVGPVCGPFPGVVLQQVVDAERGPVTAEQLEGVVVDPRRFPQLDRPAIGGARSGEAGRYREELVQACEVAAPVRRELDERRPERLPQAQGPIEVVGKPGSGVAKLHAVRSESAELEGIEESGRRSLGPRVRGLR